MSFALQVISRITLCYPLSWLTHQGGFDNFVGHFLLGLSRVYVKFREVGEWEIDEDGRSL
jgi:hypothetical protein